MQEARERREFEQELSKVVRRSRIARQKTLVQMWNTLWMLAWLAQAALYGFVGYLIWLAANAFWGWIV